MTARLLFYEMTEDDGEAIEVPTSKLADLIRELVDWTTYYVTGGED